MKRFLRMIPVFFLICMLLAACGSETAQTTAATTLDVVNVEEQIFYNVDKDLNTTLRHRLPDRETGIYSVRLAADGEVFTFQVARPELVELIDQEMFLGIKLDADGNISSIKRLHDYVGNLAVEGKRIGAIEGDVITLTGKGGPDSITLTPDTAIYNITGWEGPAGMVGQLRPNDKIYAIKDRQDQIVAVYIADRERIHDDAHNCDCCEENVQWMPWETEEELQDGGHYYLTKDMIIGDALQLKGKSVTLCLNGFSFKTRDCAWQISEGGHLKVTDHADFEGNYHGVLKGGGYSASSKEAMAGGTIQVMDDASALSVYGGNLTVELPDSGQRQVKRGGVIDNYGTVNLYGGVVTGGTVTEHGGNIQSRGTVNIYDGALLTSGYAPVDGGNIYAVEGTVNIYGGQITDGGCDNEGGNIWINTKAAVNIYGGKIANGGMSRSGQIDSDKGGNMMCFGQFLMEDGLITGGVAQDSGGNICTYTNSCNMTITGGVIADGTAPYAANINMQNNVANQLVKLDISNVEIRNGDICLEHCEANISGGTYTGGFQVRGVSVLNLSGKPVIADGPEYNLKVTAECTVNIGDLSEGASVGLTAEGRTEPIGPMADAGDILCFFSDDEAYIADVNDQQQLYLCSLN